MRWATIKPPPKNTMAQSRKISRHWSLRRWRRETAIYQRNPNTAQPTRTTTPAASSGPVRLYPG
jgi:hypothetical protein